MKLDTKIDIGSVSLGSMSVDLRKEKDFRKGDVSEITEECDKELSDQAKQIRVQEDKLKTRMDFDNDRCYYFSVVFASTEERNKFLVDKGIRLKSDMFVFYEDVRGKL